MGILEKLKINGYEAYVVGGCVRDSLLGKEPIDWDICTNATPDIIANMFHKTIKIGQRFGTIKVVLDDGDYEITTFRSEGIYSDFRRPDEVKFSDNIEEDLKRRDFTINAMAFNPEIGLIDIFNGQKHLREKLIICVGNPKERFAEDPLRIMRCIRFAAQLQFKIDNDTYEALINNKEKLKSISVERIRDEFNKILVSNDPSQGVQLIIKSDMDSLVFIKVENKEDCIQALDKLNEIEAHLILRLSMLFIITMKYTKTTLTEIEKYLKRFKHDNNTIAIINNLIREYINIKETKTSVEFKKIIRRIGKVNTPYLLKLYKVIDQSRHASDLESMYQNILQMQEPIDISDLYIRGEDLMKIGLQGPAIGEAIELLIEAVHEEPLFNKKNMLIDIIRNKYFNRAGATDGRN